jgi:hypothetical protein
VYGATNVRSALITTIATIAISCGSPNSDGDVDARVFGEQCQPGGSFGLDNMRAAVLGTLNVHVNASGLVEVDTTAELLITLEIEQNDRQVQVIASACAIEIPDVPIAGQDRPIQFEVPAVTVASVAGVTGVGTLSSPDQTCAKFTTDTFTLVIGAVLDASTQTTAPLPEADASGQYRFCPPSADTTCDWAIGVNCACDQEADAKPGATLNAYNVPAVNLDEVYVALRTQFALRGEIFSSDLILGEIDASVELGILGCHVAGGGACNSGQISVVKNLNPTITQQPGNPSMFRAIRVPADTTCEEIIAMRDTWFPR